MGAEGDDNRLAKFKDEVEKIFQNAETEISGSTFSFQTAAVFVTSLRQHVESYTTQGCPQDDLEAAVLERASNAASTLVAGVQENQVQFYDARGTIFFYFPDPTTSSLSLNNLHGPGENLTWLARLLVNLASWVERSRPHASIPILCNVNISLIIPYLNVPEMKRLMSEALVVTISSLLRMGYQSHNEEFHKLLTRKVNVADLSKQYMVMFNTVHAKILFNSNKYTKALEKTKDALNDSEDEAERREIRELVEKLESIISKQDDNASEIDVDWLTDTNVAKTELAARQVDDARSRHRPPPKHRGKRRSSTTNACGNQDARVSCPENLAAPSSVLRNSSNPRTTSSVGSPVATSVSDMLTPKPLPYSSESETDDDENDETNLQIIGYDDYEEEPVEDVLSEETVSTVVDDEKEWFEKSVEGLESVEENFSTENDVQLSPQQKELFEKDSDRNSFYYPLHKDADYLDALVKSNPEKYKRCQLKIEFSHKSVARVLDKGSKFSEILICGRSKCGQTYMDDEVVVEVLADPGQGHKLKKNETPGQEDQEDVEKMAHGRVVGMYPSRRMRFKEVEYPVLICTLDENESHLMKPLCKTVPKIHVMNDKVKEKYPTLTKHRLEIKKIENGKVKFKQFLNVDPDKREQYVFKVVILSWRMQSIYPLGAILEACIGGRDFASGLQVLTMQHSVPGVYPRQVIRETQALKLEDFPQKTERLDLTSRRVFTIDPPGSQDLDDALSIWKTKSGFVVGIHIADVASFVKVGTAVDEEAKRRAFTFYPGRRKPRPMFPEPLSHGVLSLLPGQERLAMSVFFCFDKKGNLKTNEEPRVKKTIIKSTRQFSYDEIQKIIGGDQHINVDQDTRKDVLDLHMIASQLREARIGKGGLFVPFEDPRLHDIDNVADSLQAHSLVEEFMVLTNKSVAKRLRQKFPHVMILRSHKPPTYEQLAEWREKEGNIANLVIQLQGKKTSPSTKLSVIAGAQGEDMMQNRHVIVQEHLYHRICECLQKGNLNEARRFLFMDALHPLQCLAYQHWMEMMETAEYKCSHGLNQPDHYHFGLDIEYYTHFTSPIRRYVDLHVHRLLHADLDGKAPDCKAEDVVRLCQHINNVNGRQKAFSRGCRALAIAEKLQTNPLVFRAFVDNVDSEQLTFCLPSLLSVSDRRQEVPFSVLGVSSQPEVITDTIQKKDMATVRWGMRFYNKNSKSEELAGNKTHLENAETKREDIKTFKEANRSDRNLSVPIDIYINPNQLIVNVGQGEWANMLKLLMDYKSPGSPGMPAVIERVRSEVDHISCENGDGTVSVRRVRFSMTFSPGQVIPVQMSAEPKKGLLKPRVELVQITRNANICTHHMTDPVAVLSRSARASIRSQKIESYQGYMDAWMPLLEMEAAYGAGTGDSAVVIENVEINMKCIKRVYVGDFSLPANFCFDRGIEFGGKSAGSTGKDHEYKSNSTCPMDYLCLRCRVDYDKPTVSRVKNSCLDCAVDTHYTWIGHGGVIAVTRTNRKDADGGLLDVKFVLSPNSRIPPQQLFNSKNYPVTLEVLPKSQVDRRAQEMIFQLKDQGNELAQAIAFDKSIPELDKDHRDLGQHKDNQKIVVPTVKLPENNQWQQQAIEIALTSSLSLIQGPPGTGKTYTGIKLIYLFTKINRTLAEKEKGKKGKKVVLFCGPSNKSVDNVARLLKLKFENECPKMVRLYGSAIESKDYPVPRGDLQNSRGMRDLTSDPELQEVSLHHIIRESHKPYAEKIAEFESYFDKCRENPKKFKLTSNQMRDYKRLLNKASVEELSHYEVIFTTCAVGGSPKLVEATNGSIFQVIIDECAMSPEPHSLVPIVANKAKQVVLIGDHKQLRPIITCQAAAELGLDQSLFERLHKRSSVPCVFLSTQYRMHPAICEFPSNEFYKGKLKSAPITTRSKFILPIWPLHPKTSEPVPHIFVDVRGEEETLTVSTDEGNERSKSNSAEADKVIQVLTYLKNECEENKKIIETNSTKSENKSYSIKVLTQYNAQKHLLQEKLSEAIEAQRNSTCKSVLNRYDKKNIPVTTVVSSQGDECDYVVLSTVRSLPSYKIEPHPTQGWCRQNMGFITDQNQVNVALTRARRGLIIVGNAELLRCDPVWNRLITRYEKLGCVFDSANFPPTLLAPQPRVRPHRQPKASTEWQQV